MIIMISNFTIFSYVESVVPGTQSNWTNQLIYIRRSRKLLKKRLFSHTSLLFNEFTVSTKRSITLQTLASRRSQVSFTPFHMMEKYIPSNNQYENSLIKKISIHLYNDPFDGYHNYWRGKGFKKLCINKPKRECLSKTITLLFKPLFKMGYKGDVNIELFSEFLKNYTSTTFKYEMKWGVYGPLFIEYPYNNIKWHFVNEVFVKDHLYAL